MTGKITQKAIWESRRAIKPSKFDVPIFDLPVIQEKEQQRKPKKKEIVRKGNARKSTWLEDAIWFAQRGLDIATKLGDDHAIEVLSRKIVQLQMYSFPEMGIPEYDPYLYTIDVGPRTVFDYKCETDEDYVHFLRWDCQHYMPYLRNEIIGGAPEHVCLLIIQYYHDWCIKQISTYGPRGILRND